MTEPVLTEVQEKQLIALLDAAGFGGMLQGMARLARQWARDPKVQDRHSEDLRILAVRLEDAARFVQEDTELV